MTFYKYKGKRIRASDWFSFPLDYEEIAERIGLNAEYEEYPVHDTDNFPYQNTNKHTYNNKIVAFIQILLKLRFPGNAFCNKSGPISFEDDTDLSKSGSICSCI